MTEDERAFVAACADFAREVIAPQVRDLDASMAFPAEIHAEARRRGLWAAGLPVAWGGRGLSHVALTRGGQALARVCAPIAFTLAFVHGATRPVAFAGTPEQQDRWIRALIAEGGQASWCMTEPDRAGSNLLSVGTRADRVPGGWRVRGEKCMIGMGTVARVFFVLADAWDGDQRLGPTILGVERQDGVEVGPNPPKIGFRCLPTPDVRFHDVFVDDGAVLGRPGGGLPILLDSLDYMRLGGGVVITGLTHGALDETAPWLDGREVFGGQRLGDTSYVQVVVGRLLGRLAAADALLLHAAADLDAGRPASASLAALKLVASELALDATQQLAQLWGWRGVREDQAATKRLRDARQTSVYEGTNEVLAMNLYRQWSRERG